MEDERKRERLVKEYKFSAMRFISFGALIHNMVTIVNSVSYN